MQDDVGLEVERATRDGGLAEKNGVRFTAEYFMDNYGFKPDDFTIVDPTPPPADPAAAGAPAPASTPAKPKLAALAAPAFTPKQQVLEDGVAQVAPELELPLPLAELRSAILAAGDRDELEARLAVLLDRQDPAFADLIARATFAANVIGYLHADGGADRQVSAAATFALDAIKAMPQPIFSPQITVNTPEVRTDIHVPPSTTNVAPPTVNINNEAPIVNVPPDEVRATRTVIEERDADGLIVATRTEPI
jgi:hypothetical protein